MKELFLLSPAKLNLALNIVGRREDGYHLIQSIFQYISLYDYLWFKRRSDDQIIINGNFNINQSDNLIYKACKILNIDGIEITCIKNIPLGAGLGGGSSNAATTLLALNYLFNLKISKEKLLDIGLNLGADIPFFLFGQNASIEGIGEKIIPIELPDKNFILLYPNVYIDTKEAFHDPNLVRDNPLKTSCELLSERLNVFLPILLDKNIDLQNAFYFLKSYSKVYMTGTGSCLFIELANLEKFNIIKSHCHYNWHFFAVKGLKSSPLLHLHI